MPANWELQLIASIVRDEDRSERFTEALNKGITSKVFGNAEARAVWSGIEFHYSRPEIFGRIPSEEYLLETYGNLELPDPQECFDDLCDLVLTRHQRRKTEKAWEIFLKESSQSHNTALHNLTTSLAAIQEQTIASTDVSFSDVAMEQTIQDMEVLANNDGLTGMPYPWARMNEITGGINPGDYILIYAMPKSMKTWVGLYIAVHIARTGRKVLVYSREMTWDTTRRRINCILAGVDYTKYKRNDLTEAERLRVLEATDWFANECPGDIQFTDLDRPDGEAGGPAEIRRKIEIYQPHLILLDSAYMLELPNNKMNAYDWKVLSLINRNCKQISKKTMIPVIAILQENERAAIQYKNTRGTASLAMNTGAIQDCDLAIRIVYNVAREELSLHLPAARETREKGFTVNAKAAYDFSYAHDRLWTVEEIDCEELIDPEATDEAPEVLHENLLSMTNRFREAEMFEDAEEDGEASEE